MKRQRVDHAAVIDELHTRLTEQVGAMTSTDEWLAYLQAARAFHRYSPQNQMLLALQGAQGYVASYRNWTRIPATEGGNCQVAKGQKGLVILAPMVSKSVEVDDDTGEETSRKRLRGFRTVKVFHQGQLVSPPAIPEPQMPELLTGDNRWQHVWAAVVGQLEDDGYTVTLHSRTPIEKWNGMTTWGERSVKVADDLEPPQRIKTLLHEWAHVQLGHEHRLGAERDTKEVEAESVAYLLSQTIGLDSQSYSIPYVTGWAGGDVELVQSTAEAVTHDHQASGRHPRNRPRYRTDSRCARSRHPSRQRHRTESRRLARVGHAAGGRSDSGRDGRTVDTGAHRDAVRTCCSSRARSSNNDPCRVRAGRQEPSRTGTRSPAHGHRLRTGNRR